MSEGKNILVTGGTGFVGAHLVQQLLKENHRVRVLTRSTSDRSLLKQQPVEWALGDLQDEDSLDRAAEGCHTVYHCAADYRLWAKDPSILYKINVDGSIKIFEACRKQGVQRIVYTSSVAALAVPPAGQSSCEQSRTKLEKVVGHYKRSKFLAQEAALEEAKRGLPIVIVNPSTPVGPGDLKPTATGKIILDFLKGKMPAFVDTGLNLVAVEDVARGHILAEKLGKVGELYILGNVNMSLQEILETLAHITGLPAPRFKIPYAIAWLAGAIDTFIEGKLLKQNPSIPLEGVKMARKKMYFQAERAKQELGFQPGSVPEALERAVRWFCNNGYAPKPPNFA